MAIEEKLTYDQLIATLVSYKWPGSQTGEMADGFHHTAVTTRPVLSNLNEPGRSSQLVTVNWPLLT